MRPVRSLLVPLMLLAVCAALTSCKRTVKGEESRWSSKNQTMKELAVLYPSFKAPLEARQAQAKTLYDAAQGVADEKERIGKLAEANDALGAGFVSELESIDGRIKRIRAKLVDISGAAKEAADQRRVEQTKQNVERALTEVAGRLKQGAPDASAADVVLRKVAGDLSAVEQQVAAAVPAKPAAEAKPGTTAPAAAPPVAAETWTCEYCNHVNEAGATKCSNCGAPRPAKK